MYPVENPRRYEGGFFNWSAENSFTRGKHPEGAAPCMVYPEFLPMKLQGYQVRRGQ